MTATTKNIIMASPLIGGSSNNNKQSMHGGALNANSIEPLSKNIFLLSNEFLPDLAIVDGVEGMEGEGPVRGDPVQHNIALAGLDCLAVDITAVKLMGIDPQHILYLHWAANAGLGNTDEARITIEGPALENHIVAYEPNSGYDAMVEWAQQWIDDNPVAARRPLPASYLTVRGSVNCLQQKAVIHIGLPLDARVHLEISDLKGRTVRHLDQGHFPAGRYSITWDGRDDYGTRLGSGRYIVRLHAGGINTNAVVVVAR
jgi:hypothetical protein